MASSSEEGEVPAKVDAAPQRSRWRRVWGWVWPLLAIPLLMIILGRLRAPDLPPKAPDFSVVAVDGTPIRLADFRGRTVLLNFWATWCGPCRIEMPSLASFATEHPELVVIGLASDTPEAVYKFVTEAGTPYPNAIAPKELLAAYQINTYPTTVVINPDGTIRRAYAGLAFGPHFWWLTRE